MSPAKKLVALLVLLLSCLAIDAFADPPKRQHVPMVQTPMTRTELLGALREGHLKVFGRLPSKNRLAMAWGQVAFENGHGRLVFNHNLGNVGATAPDQPTYYNRGDGQWYRSHFNNDDGAAAYWEVIKRCSAALARFDAGLPAEAAMYLKRCGYFEADLAVYTRGFSTLYYYARNDVMPEEEREQAERDRQLRAAIERSIAEADAGPAVASETPDINVIARGLDLDAGGD